MNINLFCHFNNTGVGRHSENIFRSMSVQLPGGVTLRYVDNSNQVDIREAVAASRADIDMTVFFWRYPANLINMFRGAHIVWWVFESDLLPKKWLDDVSQYDEIWVPTTWGRDVLLAHGVASNKVRVIECGVNTSVFHPAPVPHEGFVFLSVGKYEKRKSIDEIVEAFLAEFPASAYPHTRLWLKANFPLFPDRTNALAKKLSFDRRILVIDGDTTDETMARLYCMADAFVFPSKAEGFGLPCLEAIACGLPVIATDVSGHSTFLSRIPGLFVPVAFERVPIVDEDYSYFYAADYPSSDLGCWAKPSLASLRSGMREVFEQSAVWRERAQQAATVIHSSFSWDRIGRKAIARAQTLYARAR